MAKSGGKFRLSKQAVTPPNLITYARILAVPAIMIIMQFDSPRNAFIAAMVFAVASATDAVDGWLARKFNWISLIGKFLDPLADKLIVLGTLVMLLHLGRVSVWIVFIILSREIIITSLRIIAATEGLVIAARDLGKQKTAFQMVGIWCLLVHYPYPLIDALAEPVHFNRLGTYFLYISVFFSVVSAYDYFASFFRTVMAKEAEEDAAEEESKKSEDRAEEREKSGKGPIRYTQTF